MPTLLEEIIKKSSLSSEEIQENILVFSERVLADVLIEITERLTLEQRAEAQERYSQGEEALTVLSSYVNLDEMADIITQSIEKWKKETRRSDMNV